MERRRTYKSKSGAEYELVQTKAPTKTKKQTAKVSRPTKPKKQTTGEKLAGLSKEQYEKYTDAYERGVDMAESLLIALKPTGRSPAVRKLMSKRKKAAKSKSTKAASQRARKSTSKRAAKKTPKTKKPSQLQMF